MIRKEYHVKAKNQTPTEYDHENEELKSEILKMLDIAFLKGAIVELKILEGVEVAEEGKRFSKIRMDIISNTDFEVYKL